MSAPATFVKSRRKRYAACGDVAEKVGFEPTCRLITDKTISRKVQAGKSRYIAVFWLIVLGNQSRFCGESVWKHFKD